MPAFLTAGLLGALLVCLLGGLAWITWGGHAQPNNPSPVHSLEWFSWWASCLSLGFGVVALLMALAAYLKAADDNRNIAALGFTARFRADPYQQASRVLLDIADGEILHFAKTQHDGAQWRAFIKQTYVKHDLVHVLYTEFQFYDDLYECVAGNICEWRVAYNALKNEIASMSVLTGLIFDLAKNDSDVGDEAQTYWNNLGCGFQEFVRAKDAVQVGGGKVDTTACPNLVQP